MGKGNKQAFFKKANSNVQQTFEKNLKLPSYQQNANINHIEVPPYSINYFINFQIFFHAFYNSICYVPLVLLIGLFCHIVDFIFFKYLFVYLKVRKRVQVRQTHRLRDPPSTDPVPQFLQQLVLGLVKLGARSSLDLPRGWQAKTTCAETPASQFAHLQEAETRSRGGSDPGTVSRLTEMDHQAFLCWTLWIAPGFPGAVKKLPSSLTEHMIA